SGGKPAVRHTSEQQPSPTTNECGRAPARPPPEGQRDPHPRTPSRAHPPSLPPHRSPRPHVTVGLQAAKAKSESAAASDCRIPPTRHAAVHARTGYPERVTPCAPPAPHRAV